MIEFKVTDGILLVLLQIITFILRKSTKLLQPELLSFWPTYAPNRLSAGALPTVTGGAYTAAETS